MRCPACDTHTTSFIDLVRRESKFYKMPFVRTCPRCGAKIRLSSLSLLVLVASVLFFHSAIEVGSFISERYGFKQDHAVISTIVVFAMPFFVLMFLLWKHGRYVRR